MYFTGSHFMSILGVLASLALAAPVQPASPQAVTPPPTIVAGQPTSATKNIVISGVTYSLLEEKQVEGSDGVSIWSLSDPTLVARQFKTTNPEKRKAFDRIHTRIYEISLHNTQVPRKVTGNRLALFGQSRINGQGEESSWILEHDFHGKGLRQRQAWIELIEKGCRPPTLFLKYVVHKELVAKLWLFYRQTGLIHMYPDENNTMWSEDAKTLLGFIGQEHLYAPAESPPAFQKFLDKIPLGNPSSPTNEPTRIEAAIAQFAEDFATTHYPFKSDPSKGVKSWCPDSNHVMRMVNGKPVQISRPKTKKRKHDSDSVGVSPKSLLRHHSHQTHAESPDCASVVSTLFSVLSSPLDSVYFPVT